MLQPATPISQTIPFGLLMGADCERKKGKKGLGEKLGGGEGLIGSVCSLCLWHPKATPKGHLTVIAAPTDHQNYRGCKHMYQHASLYPNAAASTYIFSMIHAQAATFASSHSPLCQ